MAENTLSCGMRNAVFATLVSTCTLLSFQSTAMNMALAPLIANMGISTSVGQWVTGGYALTLAMFMPLTAYLSTRFPTRPLYLCALLTFLAGSLACALSGNFALLMCGRVTQAAANALIANVTQVSIVSIFPDESRGQAMGWLGLATSSAPIVAPVVGGALVDMWGWRSVFWVIVAVTLCALAAALAVMRNVLESAPKPFDPASFVLSLLAFGCLTLGLGNIISLGISSPVVWAGLGIGTVAGVLFARRQLRSDQPFLKLSILGIRNVRLAILCSMALYMAMMASSSVLPLYLQQIMAQTAFNAGMVILPGALCSALMSPIAGRVYDKLGMRVLMIVGGAALLASNVLMCVPVASSSLIALSILNVVRCAAVGCLMMPLTTWANASVEKQDMPHASALLTSLRNLSGALGVALFVGIFEVAGIAVCYAFMALASALVFIPAFLRER